VGSANTFLFAVRPVQKTKRIAKRRLQVKVKRGLRIDRDEVCTIQIVNQMNQLYRAGISDKAAGVEDELTLDGGHFEPGQAPATRESGHLAPGLNWAPGQLYFQNPQPSTN
jgi:hypothetical protein